MIWFLFLIEAGVYAKHMLLNSIYITIIIRDSLIRSDNREGENEYNRIHVW